jgi:signal transduction histidine kinase
MTPGAIREEALATLLHELKTPISVIVGYAELLEHRSVEATTQEAARLIKEAAEQLRSAVEQLRADAAAS